MATGYLFQDPLALRHHISMVLLFTFAIIITRFLKIVNKFKKALLLKYSYLKKMEINTIF